ncbi:hypothetical protein SteCoe_6518 [Stentor coeruleus]|uniref:Fumarylacetoacetase n=1 Tax=Stentor coeruleus TaxID=5963 RepID=A0A1R2CPW7_9CILI|nr:hypothetical protein SteCoe_6518 [Stentor coeruleus]
MESFIEIPEGSYYPLENIPYSTGHVRGGDQAHCLTRVGNTIVDLTFLEQIGILKTEKALFNTQTLNKFMSESREIWQSIRSQIQNLLRSDNQELQSSEHKTQALASLEEVQLSMPVNIGDYTDFYSSKNHAYNVGVMFRGPENALQPNWTRMPIGYHGRSSSVVVGGNVIRPRGQVCPPGGEPSFSICKKLDYELEIGCFVGGKTNDMGKSIDIADAYNNIFGIVLLNDWSARDIQAWEYIPLGPFTAKNFMTSISPWIVTLEALAPFKVPLEPQNPVPFPYLQDPDLFSYDIALKTFLKVPENDNTLISTSNMKYLYWSITQQLVHHTVTGCNMRPGDLLGSGTISGPTEDSLGCLLEISLNGKKPLQLPNGQQRTFLNDGDVLTIVGECKGNGFTIGLELPSAVVLPAVQDKYV